MRHRVQVTTLSAWALERLGVDAADDRHALTTEQWLSVPWQCLAETVGGDIFHDGPGHLTAMRARLAWYPDDPPYLVIGAERFVQALLATVQDGDLAARPLTGSVSQWVDSTDVLRRPGSAALS